MVGLFICSLGLIPHLFFSDFKVVAQSSRRSFGSPRVGCVLLIQCNSVPAPPSPLLSDRPLMTEQVSAGLFFFSNRCAGSPATSSLLVVMGLQRGTSSDTTFDATNRTTDPLIDPLSVLLCVRVPRGAYQLFLSKLVGEQSTCFFPSPALVRETRSFRVLKPPLPSELCTLLLYSNLKSGENSLGLFFFSPWYPPNRAVRRGLL